LIWWTGAFALAAIVYVPSFSSYCSLACDDELHTHPRVLPPCHHHRAHNFRVDGCVSLDAAPEEQRKGLWVTYAQVDSTSLTRSIATHMYATYNVYRSQPWKAGDPVDKQTDIFDTPPASVNLPAVAVAVLVV